MEGSAADFENWKIYPCAGMDSKCCNNPLQHCTDIQHRLALCWLGKVTGTKGSRFRVQGMGFRVYGTHGEHEAGLVLVDSLPVLHRPDVLLHAAALARQDGLHTNPPNPKPINLKPAATSWEYDRGTLHHAEHSSCRVP